MQRDNTILFQNVKRNALGYYELKDSCRRAMNDFYENEYYQQDMSLYKKTKYSEQEVEYRTNLYKEKELMFENGGGVKGNLLDVGCGEGHALKYFFDRGWSVTGIDLSEFGIKVHNPDMMSYLLKGDMMEVIKGLDKTYDFVNMDYVLEHLPEPSEFLELIKSVCDRNTIICIKVPNDFSVTQMYAYEHFCIDSSFWVTDKTSEHYNYFNAESLKRLIEEKGFICLGKVADSPIDFNLFNERTNYDRNKNLGHEGHETRLIIENMLFEQSIEKTLLLHEAMANLGVGRNISLYIKLQ